MSPSIPQSAQYRLGGVRYEVERVFCGADPLPALLEQEIITAAKRPSLFDPAAGR